MATDFDPYGILEVDRSAGPEQIDAAYRQQWAAHSRYSAPDARLREIQAAYRILSDPGERRSYDERRQAAASAPVAVAEGAPLPAEFVSTPMRFAPWDGGDILRALALIIFVSLAAAVPVSIVSLAIAGSKDVNDDPTALAVQFLAGMIFELVIVLAVWRFAVRKFHLTWAAFGIRRPERGWPWLPFGIVVLAIAIVTLYGVVTTAFGWKPDTDLPKATYNNTLPFAIAFVLAVFFAPIAEEIFFRGFLFGGLIRKWGPVPAALVTGAAFGLAHIFNPGGLYIFLPISLIGVLFCWGYYYSRSLTTTIAAHFVFNLLQMIIAFSNR